MTASMNRVMQRITKGNPRRKLFITMALCVATLVAANWARARDAAEAVAAGAQEQFQFFSFMTSSHYATYERVALWCVLGVAFLGLAYAMMLIDEVKSADTGTPKMQAVADAVRAGANAYLAQQFKKIVVLIVILTLALYFTAVNSPMPVALGRAGAINCSTPSERFGQNTLSWQQVLASQRDYY